MREMPHTMRACQICYLALLLLVMYSVAGIQILGMWDERGGGGPHVAVSLMPVYQDARFQLLILATSHSRCILNTLHHQRQKIFVSRRYRARLLQISKPYIHTNNTQCRSATVESSGDSSSGNSDNSPTTFRRDMGVVSDECATPLACPDEFLNWSFKNVELLGERNREMAEQFAENRGDPGQP
jgi:hypothetical protein